MFGHKLIRILSQKQADLLVQRLFAKTKADKPEYYNSIPLSKMQSLMTGLVSLAEDAQINYAKNAETYYNAHLTPKVVEQNAEYALSYTLFLLGACKKETIDTEPLYDLMVGALIIAIKGVYEQSLFRGSNRGIGRFLSIKDLGFLNTCELKLLNGLEWNVPLPPLYFPLKPTTDLSQQEVKIQVDSIKKIEDSTLSKIIQLFQQKKNLTPESIQTIAAEDKELLLNLNLAAKEQAGRLSIDSIKKIATVGNNLFNRIIQSSQQHSRLQASLKASFIKRLEEDERLRDKIIQKNRASLTIASIEVMLDRVIQDNEMQYKETNLFNKLVELSRSGGSALTIKSILKIASDEIDQTRKLINTIIKEENSLKIDTINKIAAEESNLLEQSRQLLQQQGAILTHASLGKITAVVEEEEQENKSQQSVSFTRDSIVKIMAQQEESVPKSGRLNFIIGVSGKKPANNSNQSDNTVVESNATDPEIDETWPSREYSIQLYQVELTVDKNYEKLKDKLAMYLEAEITSYTHADEVAGGCFDVGIKVDDETTRWQKYTLTQAICARKKADEEAAEHNLYQAINAIKNEADKMNVLTHGKEAIDIAYGLARDLRKIVDEYFGKSIDKRKECHNDFVINYNMLLENAEPHLLVYARWKEILVNVAIAVASILSLGLLPLVKSVASNKAASLNKDESVVPNKGILLIEGNNSVVSNTGTPLSDGSSVASNNGTPLSGGSTVASSNGTPLSGGSTVVSSNGTPLAEGSSVDSNKGTPFIEGNNSIASNKGTPLAGGRNVASNKSNFWYSCARRESPRLKRLVGESRDTFKSIMAPSA